MCRHLPKTWYECVSGDGTSYVRFSFYDGWSGKAVRLDNWRSHDITLYAIEQDKDGQDLRSLCPLRAFRIYWEKRKDLEDPKFLWMHVSPSFLSRAVTKVLKKAVQLANPTTPVGALPDVGMHNLRKFAFCLAFLYMLCENLQQLCDRVGSCLWQFLC